MAPSMFWSLSSRVLMAPPLFTNHIPLSMTPYGPISKSPSYPKHPPSSNAILCNTHVSCLVPPHVLSMSRTYISYYLHISPPCHAFRPHFVPQFPKIIFSCDTNLVMHTPQVTPTYHAMGWHLLSQVSHHMWLPWDIITLKSPSLLIIPNTLHLKGFPREREYATLRHFPSPSDTLMFHTPIHPPSMLFHMQP